MRRLTSLFIVVASLGIVAARSMGAEIRTYSFVPDGSLPYTAGCGECSLPYLGARADVAGTFTVSLDPATSSGTLLALNSHLVNYFEILASGTGSILQPIQPESDPGIIPPYVSEYQPPLQGTLEIGGNTFTLSGTGLEPQTDFTRVVPSFAITMQGDHATFDMHVPIIDYEITVTGAQAVQVTPEQSSLILAIIGVVLLCAIRTAPAFMQIVRKSSPPILALLVFGILSSHACATQTYTYEFIDGRGTYNRYGGSDGGGLLSGTFSLEVDGSQISVKSFDIRIEPFLDFPPSAPNPPDLSLSDILGVDFLSSQGIVLHQGAGLPGASFPPRAFVGPTVTGTSDYISTGDSYFSVDPLDGPEAFFELHAPGKTTGEQIIISPPVTGNCNEFVCTDVAFPHPNIRLIPEPSTLMLMLLAAIGIGFRRFER